MMKHQAVWRPHLQTCNGRRTANCIDPAAARIRLPNGVAGAISIDTDKSRILEGQFFQVDYDQFHHIFGVSCTDRMAAKSLLTS